MHFGHPDAIFLYFLLPVLLALLLWQGYQRKRSWKALADKKLRGKIMPSFSPARLKVRNILRLLVFLFAILTLMEPQWGTREEEVKMRGVDLMVLVDVSSSMLAQDVQPSRLERAKRKLRDLFEMLAGDRVGLIIFAGRSFLLSPLTNDYGTLELFSDEISTDAIPVQGTDVSGALNLAVSHMTDPDTPKAIILISDGEDHSEKMKKTLETLEEKKIKVFVLGVGTTQGAPIPEAGGGFKLNHDGDTVVSKLEEGFLKDLALKTGGIYVRAVTGDEDLKELYVKGVRDSLQAGDLKASKRRVWESRYYWPLGVALAFLVLERMIPSSKRKKQDWSEASDPELAKT